MNGMQVIQEPGDKLLWMSPEMDWVIRQSIE